MLHEGKIMPLPMEVNIWHKFFGFHSALIVDFEKRVKAVRILNFRHVATSDGWIFTEDLQHFAVQNPDKQEPRWRFRLFELEK